MPKTTRDIKNKDKVDNKKQKPNFKKLLDENKKSISFQMYEIIVRLLF